MSSPRRDASFLIALSASLVAHGLLVMWAIQAHERWRAAQVLALAREGNIAQAERQRIGGLIISPLFEPEVVRDLPTEPPAVSPPLPPNAPPPRREIPLGDDKGGGESAHPSPGEQPLQAKKANNTQASLSVLPQGRVQAGEGGAGGTPGSAGTEQAGADGQRAVQQGQSGGKTGKGGSDEAGLEGAGGLLKEGSSPMVGVPPQLPATPTPKAKPLPPQVQERPHGLADAKPAEKLQDSQGKAPDASPSATAKPDDKGEAPSADNRKTADKPEDNQTAGAKAARSDGGKEKGNSFGNEGKADSVEQQARERARQASASQERTSPPGEEKDKDAKRQDGVTEKPPVTGEALTSPPSKPTENPKPADALPEENPTPPKDKDERPAGASQGEQGHDSAASGQQGGSSGQSQAANEGRKAVSPGQAATGGEGDGRSPGDPSKAGDVGVQADTESDPFDKRGAITFHPGKVDAAFGRKVHWVKPRLSIAGQLDAATVGLNSLLLAITIDNTGKVTKVDVVRSSGSPDNIDFPVVRAAYSWWIEPPKNAKGEPTGDTMIWRIEFR